MKNFKLEERTEYALTLEVSKTDRIRIRFNFDSSKYSAESIERLAGLYKNICISAVNANDPQDIENVSEAYSHKLMEKIKTVSDSMKNGSITSEFEKAVKKQKDNIALEFNGDHGTVVRLSGAARGRKHHLRHLRHGRLPDRRAGGVHGRASRPVDARRARTGGVVVLFDRARRLLRRAAVFALHAYLHRDPAHLPASLRRAPA